jgi:putative protease
VGRGNVKKQSDLQNKDRGNSHSECCKVKPTNVGELLAPAGNLLSAIVAFESGADAVYVGLGKFNARERAENFTLEDLSKLINYARQNEKRVYVAFNTLIKESELRAAAESLADIAELGPDAVIVQDLGIVHLLREFFPQIPIHASTQMAIHNSYGVKAAEAMGIERVILERQVTKSEIKSIMRNSQAEIELFVHGALCCSLSGSCLFSSWLGGWSGNRGKCTQPCRRRFFSGNGNGFFFSTKDLAVPEMIPEMMKMGVASFKIEGRLKKPDYLKNVVSAYRLAIDSAAEDMQEAQEKVRRAVGRQLSQGFYSEKSMEKLIVPGRMGVTGQLCGRVLETLRGGFMASVSRKIHVGDILRLQQYAGDNSSALAVSTIKIDGRIVSKAVKGDICFIQCDREVPKDASIYKTGESFDKMSAKLATLKPLRRQLNLDIKICKSSITVDTGDGDEWVRDLGELEPAQKHPLSAEKVEEVFRASNSDDIGAGGIKVDIDGDYFMPASVLKQLRREFWEQADKIDIVAVAAENKKRVLEKIDRYIAELPRDRSGKKYSAGKSTVLCSFMPEDSISQLENKIRSSLKKGIRRFMVTSIFQIPMLSGIEGVEIQTGFPLPVCNSLAICELRTLINKLCGVGKDKKRKILSSVQSWIELEECEIRNLIDHSPVHIEMITEGCVPILVTRADIPAEGMVKDDRGAGYFIEKDAVSGLTTIYPDKYFKIDLVKGASAYKLHSDIPVDRTRISKFNFEREFV